MAEVNKEDVVLTTYNRAVVSFPKPDEVPKEDREGGVGPSKKRETDSSRDTPSKPFTKRDMRSSSSSSRDQDDQEENIQSHDHTTTNPPSSDPSQWNPHHQHPHPGGYPPYYPPYPQYPPYGSGSEAYQTPSFPPVPPPSILPSFASMMQPSAAGEDAMTKLMMAWYHAGYVTGAYQAMQHHLHHQNKRPSEDENNSSRVPDHHQ